MAPFPGFAIEEAPFRNGIPVRNLKKACWVGSRERLNPFRGAFFKSLL
jgi:hypothetical protein